MNERGKYNAEERAKERDSYDCDKARRQRREVKRREEASSFKGRSNGDC